MNGPLDLSFADFGPAQLSAAVIAVYLVVGEPFVGYVLHRRFEGRLRTDPAARLGVARQWLHAVRLGFPHPADGRWVEFTSEYPADLAGALAVLRADT